MKEFMFFLAFCLLIFESKCQNLQKCGKSTSSSGLVANGKNLTRGTLPWIVALMYMKKDQTLNYFCGGSLISQKLILTGRKINKFLMKLFKFEQF